LLKKQSLLNKQKKESKKMKEKTVKRPTHYRGGTWNIPVLHATIEQVIQADTLALTVDIDLTTQYVEGDVIMFKLKPLSMIASAISDAFKQLYYDEHNVPQIYVAKYLGVMNDKLYYRRMDEIRRIPLDFLDDGTFYKVTSIKL